MRIQASKQYCSFFSLMDFRVSVGASSTPNMIRRSHDSSGSGINFGVNCGLNDLPKITWTTDSSSPRTAARAASPARIVAEVVSVFKVRPGCETVSCLAVPTGARWCSLAE